MPQPSQAPKHGATTLAFSAQARQGICRRKRACRTLAMQVEVTESIENAEQQILQAVSSAKGRGKSGVDEAQLADLEEAVRKLEADGGVRKPTANEELLDGRWRLLYTSRPGSASPIQRAFTGTEAFAIFQEITLAKGQKSRVNNIVEFGKNAKIGVLRVEAEASTDTRPLEGFSPRKGAGFPLLGKSKTDPPARENIRVDFQFDKAAFNFRALPFKIPYPVPFKLFGDETKGWIDITYMNKDGSFRLTRGNKGTLFVLKKDETIVDSLLAAIRDKDTDRIKALIDELSEVSPTCNPARSGAILGKWRLLWSEQASNANPLQKALSSQVNNWQILTQQEDGVVLENRVDLGLAKVRAMANCSVAGNSRTEVRISEVFAEVFGLRVPLGGKRDSVGFVDWVYLDDRIRVQYGNKGSVFVHVRETA